MSWKIARWVGGVLLVGIVGLIVTVLLRWNRTFDVPLPDIHASTDSGVIASGRYLAFGPAHCAYCHTTAETAPAARVSLTRDRFWSAGVSIANGAVFNPLDYWGFGYAQTELVGGERERMLEGYYNFELSQKLRLSFHLQHQFERAPGTPDTGFLVPAVRVQARF